VAIEVVMAVGAQGHAVARVVSVHELHARNNR
jgi:hypothetical protein